MERPPMGGRRARTWPARIPSPRSNSHGGTSRRKTGPRRSQASRRARRPVREGPRAHRPDSPSRRTLGPLRHHRRDRRFSIASADGPRLLPLLSRLLPRSARRRAPQSPWSGPGSAARRNRSRTGSGVGRREPGYRDPERGARDVVQTDRVTELDACGVASVFAANADLEIPANLATLSDAYPHELTDPVAVDCLERVARENPLLDVIEEELWLRVIAAVSHRRLREVVRPEGEEFGVAGDFVRDESGPRDLNHRAELVVHGDPLPVHDALLLLLQGPSFDSQLLGQAYQRDHDLRADVDAFFLETARRFEDGAHLHLRDLGEHDPEATAPEAQHRVRLARTFDRLEKAFLSREESFDSGGDIGTGLADFGHEGAILFGGRCPNERIRILARDPQFGHLDEQRLVARQELVERRGDEPDDHPEPRHLPPEADEGLPPHPTQGLPRTHVPPPDGLPAGNHLRRLAFEISTTVIRSRLHLVGERLSLPFDLAVLGCREDH